MNRPDPARPARLRAGGPLAALLLLAIAGPALALVPMPGEGEPPEHREEPVRWGGAVERPGGDLRRGGLVADRLFAWYGEVSRASVHRCPFRTSCSRFARQALARHGAPGLLLAVDRILYREHPHAARHYPAVREGGRFLLDDDAFLD